MPSVVAQFAPEDGDTSRKHLARIPESGLHPLEIGGPVMFKWKPFAPYAVAGLLSLFRPGMVAAQTDGLDLEVDKAMAKARFDVDQAKSAELARQMVQAARDVYEFEHARYRLGGTTTPDALLQSELMLRQAELVAKGDTAPGTVRITSGPLLELAWRQAWQADDGAGPGDGGGVFGGADHYRDLAASCEDRRGPPSPGSSACRSARSS
jgi:hypothetical protein